MLRAGVMSDGMVRREVTGTPQGGPISPLLCNVYLHRLDRAWDTRALGVLVRFADDAVVMCRSRQQAEAALARLTQLLAELGLEPKAAKTRIVHLTEGGEGLDFLPAIVPSGMPSDMANSSDRVTQDSRGGVSQRHRVGFRLEPDPPQTQATLRYRPEATGAVRDCGKVGRFAVFQMSGSVVICRAAGHHRLRELPASRLTLSALELGQLPVKRRGRIPNLLVGFVDTVGLEAQSVDDPFGHVERMIG
jgi:hypothetical protein